MPAGFVPVLSMVALVTAFTIDLLIPQLVVATILFDVPVVLSNLGGSRQFRIGIVVAALLANAVAGYVNAVLDHMHWDVVSAIDRVRASL